MIGKLISFTWKKIILPVNGEEKLGIDNWIFPVVEAGITEGGQGVKFWTSYIRGI